MFVKICGLRTPDIVATCVDLGVDAIGFVFADGSPRQVTTAQASTLIERVPASVEKVGVFVKSSVSDVVTTVRESGVDTAQLHGDWSRDEILAIEAEGVPVIRALSVSEFRRDGAPTGRVLIDGDSSGSGAVFDPALLAGHDLPAEWMLAGGLTPANVAERIAALQPFGVDVSSGVESERGVKSAHLITEFVNAARSHL